ncbi:MAG: ATP-binding cassette domain-containing protein, partial [Microterricola sp.]
RRTTPSDADVVAQSIERVGLSGLEKRAVHSLSGGQMQRVLLAQGIAQRAELLLLDEPMNGVDEETSAQIRRLIDEEACRGRTVVHVSHDEQVIGAAGRLIRLERGRIRPLR